MNDWPLTLSIVSLLSLRCPVLNIAGNQELLQEIQSHFKLPSSENLLKRYQDILFLTQVCTVQNSSKHFVNILTFLGQLKSYLNKWDRFVFCYSVLLCHFNQIVFQVMQALCMKVETEHYRRLQSELVQVRFCCTALPSSNVVII